MKRMSFGRVGTVNLISERGKFLLMRRSDDCRVFPGVWGLIGGFLNWGEKAEEGVRREAMEEVGIGVEIVRFSGHYYNSPSPTQKNVISLPFYTRIVKGVPHPNQPEECSDVKWFSPKEIEKLPMVEDHRNILRAEGLI